MRRHEWFELHDHRLYPAFLRDLMTDALEGIWNYTNSYRVILPRLRAAMEQAGVSHVVDLCSGAGGPWVRLQEQLAVMENYPVSVSLTDKYPSEKALTGSRLIKGVDFYPVPVDARRIPAELDGFRTIFSTFHHFNPETARAILVDAVAQRRGIAVFEAAGRSFRAMLITSMVPALCWRVTPKIEPFRWSRLLWTYLLPVVPFTLLVDGILSCLRAYSVEDLRELAFGLGGNDYRWEVGEQDGGRVAITYLIGAPIKRSAAGEHSTAAISVRK